MKKTVFAFFSLIIILVMIASVFLAIDVETNLKVRRKINSVLNPVEIVKTEPKAININLSQANIDSNSNWIITEKETHQNSYMNVMNLSTEWMTSLMDASSGTLSIVDGKHQIEIQTDGTVRVNGQETTHKVELQTVKDRKSVV